MAPSTYARVYPLTPQPKPEEKLKPSPPGLKAPKHYSLSTPPLEPGAGAVTGAGTGVEGLVRPLQAFEFPLPDFRTLSRKEERTIAQKNQVNIENANDKVRYLGLHVVRGAAKG